MTRSVTELMQEFKLGEAVAPSATLNQVKIKRYYGPMGLYERKIFTLRMGISYEKRSPFLTFYSLASRFNPRTALGT